jgi:hypothetical protein
VHSSRLLQGGWRSGPRRLTETAIVRVESIFGCVVLNLHSPHSVCFASSQLIHTCCCCCCCFLVMCVSQGRRSFDYVGPTGADSSGSSRGLQSSAMLRAAAAAEAAAGSNGVGTTLLCGAGGVGSAAGSVDAAAAAGAGLVQKQNHRIVHNGVIQVGPARFVKPATLALHGA